MRDALGVALPVGVPEAFTEPVRDPLGDSSRATPAPTARSSPRTSRARFGLGVAVVRPALARLAADRPGRSGEFRPGGAGTEWCDAEVLRTLRRRSLAALRKEVEPVPPEALARFLPGLAGRRRVAPAAVSDGLLRAVEQLAGVARAGSALETLVLPARVADYSPALLDELTAAGEVVWAGAGSLAGNDGWIALAPAERRTAAARRSPRSTTRPPTPCSTRSTADEALFFRSLVDRVHASPATSPRHPSPTMPWHAAIWDLVWAGLLTNDTLAPVRALLGRPPHGRARPVRPGSAAPRYARYARPARRRPHRRPERPARPAPPLGMAGRWSRAAERASPTRPGARWSPPRRCSTGTAW